ncbi:RNA polymerase sigma factor [Pseudodesulfovibrio sp.]|uniref:RNA polymerase sigma factor n=1 Tax=Pseudodesulfovibrio sp. TaxID=2035812 RepID=UPI0026333180|nr:RNA polymerase sigma factor [Pseudodesulfovibrio sp.]MDD3312897.1 RNA polymerase sigma factor [Pseudodesulfovibrio sp.]
MAGQPDDMSIIAAVVGGDVDAFGQLLARYETAVGNLVAAHVPGEDVAEVAHDAFVRAFKALPGYRPTAPFLNWLTTIALRSCHDFWRDRYRRREAPASDLSDDGQRFLEAALAANSREEFDRLARAREAREVLALVLDQLAPLDRLVLTLTSLEERTVGETAEMLGISVPNVKIRAYRARLKLRHFLKRYGIQGGDNA